MSQTVQKIALVQKSIDDQLKSFNFIAVGDVSIPVTMVLDNNIDSSPNVFKVDSLEQAKEISVAITDKDILVDNVISYDKPLYLTVSTSLPV